MHRFANISELMTTEHIALAESVVFGQPPLQPEPRIASLVPSLTELVSVLGLGPQLTRSLFQPQACGCLLLLLFRQHLALGMEKLRMTGSL